MECNVSLRWDDEANVWLASSNDVPGLALESGSLDALMERVKYAIPDLLGLKGTELKINFHAERMARDSGLRAEYKKDTKKTNVKNKLLIIMTAIVAIAAGGAAFLELQQASAITINLNVQNTNYIARQQAQYLNGHIDGYIQVLRVTADIMGHFEEIPAEERRDRYDEMLYSIFEEQPDFIRMFTVWKPNALDGMDSRYIGRAGATSTGQAAFELSRNTGLITFFSGSTAVVDAVMQHINGPNAHKDSVDNPVPVTSYKETYAVRIFVPIINKRSGETAGAVGCYLNIDFVQPWVERAIKGNDEVAALSVYSNNGFIMGSYYTENIGKMLLDSEALYGDYISAANEAVKTGRDFFCDTYDPLLRTNLQVVIVPVAIGNSDATWSIMAGSTEDYILREVNIMTRFTIILLIVVIVLAAVIINIVLRAVLIK